MWCYSSYAINFRNTLPLDQLEKYHIIQIKWRSCSGNISCKVTSGLDVSAASVVGDALADQHHGLLNWTLRSKKVSQKVKLISQNNDEVFLLNLKILW